MIAFVILWLDNKSGIPVKIMKENINIVSNLNHNDFNNLLLSSNFYYWIKKNANNSLVVI